MNNLRVIAVDFDGTLCENKWPYIGEPNIELIECLKDLKKNDEKVRLILWTCREGQALSNAVEWCANRKLIFDAVNDNIKEIHDMFETNSRKIYANEYIDDRMCNGFELPFIYKKEELISKETLEKVESIYGFKLHDWQYRYLIGYTDSIPVTKRNSGKTFAYCIKLLLGKDQNPIPFNHPYIVNLSDNAGYGRRYDIWFCNYLVDMHYTLTENGLKTNMASIEALTENGLKTNMTSIEEKIKR